MRVEVWICTANIKIIRNPEKERELFSHSCEIEVFRYDYAADKDYPHLIYYM